MPDETTIPPAPPAPEGPPPGDGHRATVAIEDEMRKSYLDYSMSVIIGRALPDVRDGLKPVHRRILYSMQELGLDWNKKYMKCARVVGEAMGKSHPHGNLAIYDALVRMAQDFSMRVPLVDGQGNFGSVDGDPPAAPRQALMARASSRAPSGNIRPPRFIDPGQSPGTWPARRLSGREV